MRKRHLLLLGTFLLSMLLYVDRACISTAKEHILADLGFDDKLWGWILGVFALGYALCQVPAGALADRFGPRRVLAGVVAFWSIFTAATGAAWNFVSMLAFRLLFGAGEAGAFPGASRAYFSWIPSQERGLAQGITFSGSRIGAAVTMPLMPLLINAVGWRETFFLLGAAGIGWSVFWWLWFRDDPEEHPTISEEEKAYILANRQQPSEAAGKSLSPSTLFGSANMWLAMLQYICSNFTFYFAIGWSFPYVKKTFELSAFQAGIWSGIPLLCGALGNWVSGGLVDRLYRAGFLRGSRRFPAALGFVLAAAGIAGTAQADTAAMYCLWLSVAIFGADMTLSPSWAFSIDIGREHAGTVSGTMNMAGNLAAFLTMLAFPYLQAWTHSHKPYFYLAAVLNLAAAGMWYLTRPDKPLEEY
ncbi:MFS transporter [Thermostilla marina]